MNKWRIAGLILLVMVAGGLVLRYCTRPEQPTATIPTAPPREVFHASKPLRVEIIVAPGKDRHEWLERELRFVLARGKMRIAARGPEDSKAFVLRVDLSQGSAAGAKLLLIAPDDVQERELTVPVSLSTRLETVQSLTRQLPTFLGAATATDWTHLPGTSEADAYESFLAASSALLDSNAQGFTQPQRSRELAHRVEALEALVRKQPSFARAQGLLAIAYLGLGGEDQSSLTQLADATAKRALALDESLADAHSAIGLARLRHGEWIAARERFDAALEIDSNAVPALEGLACLLTAVGQSAAALPIAQHAVAMQAGNIGAQECLAYARAATAEQKTAQPVLSKDLPVARAGALSALLAGDVPLAEQMLQHAAHDNDAEWIKPLLQAALDKKAIPEALRAITRAAGDGQIDSATEVMSGAALHQADFVFNRLSRLEKQNEAVPLQLLWLPQTAFLRKHRRFEQLVTAVDLTGYWQENGRPEICETEPQVYGCALRPSAAKQKSAEHR
jgi:tetratricopeptide (TPR) repeat protein